MPELFEWIAPDRGLNLAIMPRPPGGNRLDFALAALQREGVDVLVSLQPEQEAALCGLEREAEVADMLGMEFVRHPITDHGVPSSADDTLTLARTLAEQLGAGQGVLLHCYAGIGRAGLMAILTLGAAGLDLNDAVERASKARMLRVPETTTQLAWLEEAFEQRLGRPPAAR
ncbi:MAG TPA: protein-tyrosine phosphatase family protein [Myxococcales bacterium LLY-WYZ-16_1]|nr:protein-tyrosine phosphatase family protein [Myxococcales bacterium LLY-WYZ-16_1]